MNKREIYQRAQKFCLEHHIEEYPVKIVGLCNECGFEVHAEPLPQDVAGFIVVQDEPFTKFKTGKVIICNSNDRASRQRFTIAHELAHFVLHRNESQKFFAHRDVGQRGGIETEADLFAAQILMPADLVFKAFEKLEKELRVVPQSMKARYIADEFAVSVEAAHIRLEQLGVFC